MTRHRIPPETPGWIVVLIFLAMITGSLWLAGSLHAEEPNRNTQLRPVHVKPPGTTPTVTPELEIRYLRALMNNQAAQKHAAETLATQQKTTQEVVKACGDKHVPQDPGRRIVCVAKEKPTK